MKLTSKNKFHAIIDSLQDALRERGTSVKTTKLQDILAASLSYKSWNGLASELPIDIAITAEHEHRFASLLKQNHGFDVPPSEGVLRFLERTHESYSTHWNSDANCYPTTLSKFENYWYLTEDGWKPWRDMDFDKMRVELNIYEVVHSHASGLGGVARSIWDASISSREFERVADKLKRKYGDMPAPKICFANIAD